MHITHAPQNYICPICVGVEGIENESTLIRKSDIVYKDDVVMVFIASYFIGENSGHLIVVPLKHIENIYSLPDEISAHIAKTARKMCLVMRKAYGCEGITTLQNNEPAAGQHAFHYHLHLFPRYSNDMIYDFMNAKRETTQDERLPFAHKIKKELVEFTHE